VKPSAAAHADSPRESAAVSALLSGSVSASNAPTAYADFEDSDKADHSP
jgi:hypothetical protein